MVKLGEKKFAKETKGVDSYGRLRRSWFCRPGAYKIGKGEVIYSLCTHYEIEWLTDWKSWCREVEILV